MTLPAVTKHLKVLQRAGLITRGREAQWRPCQLAARPLRDVAHWVEQYRRFWDGRLDRLEGYLRELKAQDIKPARIARQKSARHAKPTTPPRVQQEKRHGRRKK